MLKSCFKSGDDCDCGQYLFKDENEIIHPIRLFVGGILFQDLGSKYSSSFEEKLNEILKNENLSNFLSNLTKQSFGSAQLANQAKSLNILYSFGKKEGTKNGRCYYHEYPSITLK